MHGDHVYGLPSMLLHLNVANTQNRRSRLTLGATGITRKRDGQQDVSSHQIQQEYSEGSPLHLYGPEGLYNYVTSALRLSHARLRMKVNFYFFISFSVIGVIVFNLITIFSVKLQVIVHELVMPQPDEPAGM